MNLAKLQAQADQDYILTVLKEWTDKSKDDKLQELTMSQIRLFTYINTLELEAYSYNKIVGEFRSERNRAIMRTRNAEGERDFLETKVKDLENKLKIFGI
tara:strand:+ start:4846 stop:5145 length:300 start_codon:yes stop_codon:yes gene_type:complete